MIPEIGNFAVTLALLIAVTQSVAPIIGVVQSNQRYFRLGVQAAKLQAGLLIISFAALAYAFLTDDFSVSYVANHSNSDLPVFYKFAAIWGGHEGSLLLWGLILALWTLAVAMSRHHPGLPQLAKSLGVMGLISIGFLSFLIFTSNPFERLLPIMALEGADLNPLLQDFGLIVHPPMLYMGYVGFSVAFALAITALIEGRLDSAWVRWMRPWTLYAWMFLTLGIALGSWWAYYELGWGGWWFWDPVENASFMPWLAGTALLHSIAVSEKRGNFKNWTLLLAILTFSLSLLGTFLVRSGVLVSVHAFATDPVRGTYILMFLAIIIGGSLSLYALRAHLLSSASSYQTISREMAILINNLFLVVSMLMVLIGTLQPVLSDAMGWGKYSVGPPYFNIMFAVLMLPLVLLMGFGPELRWKKDGTVRLTSRLRAMFVLAVIAGILLPLILNQFKAPWYVLVGTPLALWVIFTVVQDFIRRSFSKTRGFKKQPLSYYGMQVAHIGVAVSLIGILLTSAYSVEKDLRVAVGQRVDAGSLSFELTELRQYEGPNFRAIQGVFDVYTDSGKFVETLRPEKRIYNASGQPMTEAAIDPGLFRDIYIAMGEPLDEQSWAVRIYNKPFVRWIWLGSILMGVGALLSIRDRKYLSASKLAVKQGSTKKEREAVSHG